MPTSAAAASTTSVSGSADADSVKRALTLLGAKENQIESVSLGEEKKPVCTEHAEDCWAKNRRADMLYSGRV